jgi:asparagine synthase (glutamine-hydrolysing)
MCGIAGLVTRDGVTPPSRILDALTQALAHRGPDGSGRHVRGNVGFVQTRLAIIDLNTGNQPIFAPDGSAIVANGEVYNHLELHADLPEVRFVTASDCEPPLHLYREAGLAFTSRLRGMYAIAIHDPHEGRVVLTRDPFGIKPLYLAETPIGLAFASEPQALIKAGLVAPKLRQSALNELLQLQFTTGRDSIFEGISRLLPGETISIEQGEIAERRRLEALPAGGPRSEPDIDLTLNRLDEVLTNSVTLHQRSDVPYGMFLSGGIDSSALLAMMARLNERPVMAFTAGFPGTEAHDERAKARYLAEIVGAEHVEVEFTEGDFWSLLPGVAASMDDPAADYACLPTFKLAAEARKHVKVILSGEGGDELFAGYGRYRAAARPWPLARPMRRNGVFDGLGVLRNEPKGWRDGIHRSELAEAKPGRSKLQIAQAVDIADWLPNDLLTKLDRCLMAHGVEGRVPFLDPLVADFAFRLPDRLKIHKGLGKHLLRLWLNKVLPESQAFAKKRGFTVPVGEWIAAKSGKIAPLVARQPCIEAICLPGTIEPLFEKGHFAAWSLLFYALWHRIHIEGQKPEGGVFEMLE